MSNEQYPSDSIPKPDEVVLYATLDEQDAKPRYRMKSGDVFEFKGIKLTAIPSTHSPCGGCHFRNGDCYSNVLCVGASLIFATDETVVEAVTARLIEGKNR